MTHKNKGCPPSFNKLPDALFHAANVQRRAVIAHQNARLRRLFLIVTKNKQKWENTDYREKWRRLLSTHRADQSRHCCDFCGNEYGYYWAGGKGFETTPICLTCREKLESL
jgi:hypothetical protein